MGRRHNGGKRTFSTKFHHPELGDWKCTWCDTWLSATTSQVQHEKKSQTCQANKNRKLAEGRGLARAHDFALRVAGALDLAPEVIRDVFVARGWGRTRTGSNKYLPAWFVRVCEGADRNDAPEEWRASEESTVKAYAALIRPALVDATLRDALEATARVGGWTAIYNMASKETGT